MAAETRSHKLKEQGMIFSDTGIVAIRVEGKKEEAKGNERDVDENIEKAYED